MAYGKGSAKTDLKRMADLGQTPMTPELAELRRLCLLTVQEMAQAVWPEAITDPRLSGKELDRILLRIQSDASKRGLNNVWAEKMRLLAKPSVTEQWKRAQARLFGRLKHVSARAEAPAKDGTRRLLNLSEIWTSRLSEADVAALQALTDQLDFPAAMRLFRDLRSGDAGLTPLQAEALREMEAVVSARSGCPVWGDEAAIQMHLDYRCVRGGADALATALAGLASGLDRSGDGTAVVEISSHRPRGPAIRVPLRLPRPVAARHQGDPDQTVRSLVLELGPDLLRPKAVLLRQPRAPEIVGAKTVLAEDFGYANTSSMVVVRCADGVSAERVAFAGSKPGKRETRAFLETHVSGAEVEVLERVQISGRAFLARIAEHADRIDTLRSEIDLGYARLGRLKGELNRLTGADPRAPVQEAPEEVTGPEAARYRSMHGRFFRLLNGLERLKARRRALYRRIDGLKKSWFGHVANVRAALAERYGAVVASEALTVLAEEKTGPGYKGRTFNKLINNGAKGQYTRRADDTLKWRGVATLKLPSFYTSSTDWRTGTVDKGQRSGSRFLARDGTEWDADLHAAELLARWLFLRPKPAAPAAASTL
jgi:hypothetical protein